MSSLPEPCVLVDGFNSTNLIYMLPIVRGIAEERGIRKIIFVKKTIDTFGQDYFNRTFSSFDIEVFKTSSTLFRSRKTLVFYYQRLVSTFVICLLQQRAGLLTEERSRARYFAKHAVWDLAINLSPDGTLRPSFLTRLRVFTRLRKIELLAAFLSRFENGSVAVLGHNVYERRLLVARLHELKFSVFFHAGYCVTRQKKWTDVLPIIPTETTFEFGNREIADSTVENFWNRRLQGDTINTSTVEAMSIKPNKAQPPAFDAVFFLPVFRDSPFALLDDSRIFADYVDWLEVSLRICLCSGQRWLLKPHPSQKRWGEDSSVLVKKILERVECHGDPRLVVFDDSLMGYFEIFKSIKRVVTFRGTVHLEAACFGIRPIVISACLLTERAPNLVFKPKTISDYESALRSSDDSSFVLTEMEQKLARRLLFYREELIPFIRDVGGGLFLRGDSSTVLEAIQQKIISRLPLVDRQLHSLGARLALGLEQTTSLTYASKSSA